MTTRDYSLAQLRKRAQAARVADRGQPTSMVRDLAAGLGVSAATLDRVQVTGTGWASVVTLPPGTVHLTDPQLRALTTARGADRVLSTALLNVVIRADGSVRLGSVDLARL